MYGNISRTDGYPYLQYVNNVVYYMIKNNTHREISWFSCNHVIIVVAFFAMCTQPYEVFATTLHYGYIQLYVVKYL